MDSNLVKNFKILYQRMDNIEAKVDSLGRRIEENGSSFQLVKITTLNQFEEFIDVLLKNNEEYKLLVCIFYNSAFL